MIVDNAVYRHGVRVPLPIEESNVAAARAEAGAGDFVWVGLHEPTQDEMAEVAGVFGLHHLAVEDSLKADQRPKLELYEDDDMLFLALKTLWYVDAEDAVETGEIYLFVGGDYVVSVRHGAGGQLSSSRHWLERREEVLTHGPSSVVYAVCDHVVDDYELVAAELETDVNEVEESVFSTERTSDAARIYILKRELAEFRRAVMPLRAPISRFAAGTVPGISQDTAPFFRDVADHVFRVAETVDQLDGLLSTAFDGHIAQISLQQNDDMRKISAGIGLVAAPTLIGSIYGMNFSHMPELHWGVGYPFALGLMALSSLAVWILFKRSGWL